MIFGMKHFKMEEAGGEEGGAGGTGSFMGGSGADAGNSGTPPASDGGQGGQGDGDKTYQYPQGLDESYYGNPTLLRYANEDGSFDQAKIFKDLIHSKSMIGTDKIAVPNKNFTEEQWRETFHKLGVPEKLEDYKIDVNAPEGFDLNEELVNGLKETAHKLGVLPKQLQGIIDHYNQFTAQDVQKSNESWQNQLNEEKQALEKEWGESFNNQMGLAEQALMHFFPDQAEREALAKTGILDTAIGTKLFAKLGNGLKEDGFDHNTTGSFGATPEQVDEMIKTTFTELQSMGRMHPQYQSKLKEYQNLLNKKHGSTPVGTGAPIRPV